MEYSYKVPLELKHFIRRILARSFYTQHYTKSDTGEPICVTNCPPRAYKCIVRRAACEKKYREDDVFCLTPDEARNLFLARSIFDAAGETGFAIYEPGEFYKKQNVSISDCKEGLDEYDFHTVEIEEINGRKCTIKALSEYQLDRGDHVVRLSGGGNIIKLYSSEDQYYEANTKERQIPFFEPAYLHDTSKHGHSPQEGPGVQTDNADIQSEDPSRYYFVGIVRDVTYGLVFEDNTCFIAVEGPGFMFDFSTGYDDDIEVGSIIEGELTMHAKDVEQPF